MKSHCKICHCMKILTNLLFQTQIKIVYVLPFLFYLLCGIKDIHSVNND